MTNLVIPTPSAPAYDAYVTYLQDEGIGVVKRYDVELWLPFPGEDAGGTCAVIDGQGRPPRPDIGRNLAVVINGIPELERALVKVHGVPCPGWAIELYRDLLGALDGRVTTDLLAVEGYRWESWVLSGGLPAVA